MPDHYSVEPGSTPTRACPRCSTPLPGLATVCAKCGYDMANPPPPTASATRSKAVDEHGEPAGTPPRAGLPSSQWPEFIPASPTRTKMFLIVGCLLALGAAIATIYYRGQEETGGVGGFFRQIGRAVLVMYTIALHTGTGVVAVWITARATQHRFGSLESAASRMFVLVSAFFFVTSIELPLGDIRGVVSVVLAAGLYWLLAVVILGRKTEQVNLLSFVHVVLFFLIFVGMVLYSWLNPIGSKITPAPPAQTAPIQAPAPLPAPTPSPTPAATNPTGSAGG